MKAITDNAYKVCYRDIGYSEQDLSNLKSVANISIGDLALRSPENLLVFPPKLDYNGDGISNQHILSIHDEYLNTGNILGFVGINETRLRIKSRFAKEDDKDFFLHYLLQKVFAINLFDLKTETDEESIFDFLLYLFPYYFKKALAQGLYKEYRKNKYNDANVRGVIDINRHINENIPFKGAISYCTREHCFDNKITELIRHTIEFIETKPLGRNILQNDAQTKEFVRQIRQATPSYAASQRQNIINSNLRPVHHPYYSAYSPLQKICLQILKHQGIKYGEEKDKIYGVLFDGSWLWEEYLNTILKEEGFKHPRNKESKGGFRMFLKPKDDDKFDNNTRRLFPDFYKDNFILDAKYKHLNTGVGREDLYQVVTYMYCRRAHIGAYVYPFEDKGEVNQFQLSGYGDSPTDDEKGFIYLIPFEVPQAVGDWKDFCNRIAESENTLKEICRRTQ